MTKSQCSKNCHHECFKNAYFSSFATIDQFKWNSGKIYRLKSLKIVLKKVSYFQWWSNLVILLSELQVPCNTNVSQCKSWVTYKNKNDLSSYLINIEGDLITPGLNFMNVSVESIKIELTKSFLFQANVKIFKNPIGARNESTKFMDVTTDLCKFFKKKSRGDPLAKYMIGLVERYGKIPYCPLLPVSFVDFYLFFTRKYKKRSPGSLLRS